jgi:transposase InsO family protein
MEREVFEPIQESAGGVSWHQVSYYANFKDKDHWKAQERYDLTAQAIRQGVKRVKDFENTNSNSQRLGEYLDYVRQSKKRTRAFEFVLQLFQVNRKHQLTYTVQGPPTWALSFAGEAIADYPDETTTYRIIEPNKKEDFFHKVYKDATRASSGSHTVVYRYIVDSEKVLGFTDKEIIDFIKNHKGPRVSTVTKIPFVSSYRPRHPLQIFQIDVTDVWLKPGTVSRLPKPQGAPPPGNGNARNVFRMITMVDIFSKVAWVKRIDEGEKDEDGVWDENFQPTTRGHIRFLHPIFCRGDRPRTLQVDNAAYYTSEEFRTYLTSQKVNLKVNPSYRPQANGVVERMHKTVKRRLAMALSSRRKISVEELDLLLQQVVYGINHNYSAVTGKTPMLIHRGVARQTTPATHQDVDFSDVRQPRTVLHQFMRGFRETRDKRFDAIRERIHDQADATEARLRQQFTANFQTGDVVQVALFTRGPKGWSPTYICRPLVSTFSKANGGILEGGIVDRELNPDANEIELRPTDRAWTDKYSSHVYHVVRVYESGSHRRVFLSTPEGLPVVRISEYVRQPNRYLTEDYFPEYMLLKVNQIDTAYEANNPPSNDPA